MEIRDTRFDEAVTILGIERQYDSWLSVTYFLRSYVDKKSVGVKHQLYVNGLTPTYWNAANDEDAERLEFVCVDTSCRNAFDFAAHLPDQKLRSRRLYGYSVKFYSREGATRVITLTPDQIGAQLDAVDAVRKRLRP